MNDPDISLIASMISDYSRSKILLELMSGRAMTTNELASCADITASTASTHIKKLATCGIIIHRKQGRHCYVQLANRAIAELIEQMLVVSSYEGKKDEPSNGQLTFARSCYDHLAGLLATLLFEALSVNQFLDTEQHSCSLTEKGKKFFQQNGCDINSLESTSRPLCRACLDWSERRSHLAGSLGQWILDDILARKWAVRDMDSRTLIFSDIGLKKFKTRYGFNHALEKRD